MALFKRKAPVLASTLTLPIVGMQYYTSDIEAIGTPLKGYHLSQDKMSQTPYKDYYKLWFNCDSVQLVPDPHNKTDKNAIMVVVDGHRIGYVPADSTTIVRQYMNVPHSLAASIHGGAFKTWVPSKVVSSFKQYSGEITITLI